MMKFWMRTAMLAAAGPCALGQVLYTESFDASAGGWDVVTTLNNTFPVSRVAAGGWPGAYIQSNDPDDGVSYWRAPPAFRTALSGAQGGSIVLASRISVNATLIEYPDVIATGAGLSLYYNLPQPDSTSWITHRISLDACAAWRVGSTTGPVATAHQLGAVLAACTEFRIRAEFRDGAESDDLDSVEIDGWAPNDEARSTFDSSAEGWTTVADAHPPTWAASGGNPDGYLRAVDIGDGRLWLYSAPAKFLCEQSRAIGGVLSFDIRASANGYFYPAENPDVWIIGTNGLVLGARMSSEPGASWTHYEFPMTPQAWRLGDMRSRVPTSAEFDSVLSSVASLRIRGEFSSEIDIGGLDNVFLGQPFPCPADFNQDGGIDGADIEAFFAAWERGDFAADVNRDGGIDGADVETFFAAWENGGCG